MSLSSALAAAAALGRTLIVYMGVQRLAHIQTGLLTALGGDTPAALVQHASTVQERRLVTTLGRLAADAAQAGIGSPAILIVGDVLEGAQALADVPADDGLPQALPLRATGARSMI